MHTIILPQIKLFLYAGPILCFPAGNRNQKNGNGRGRALRLGHNGSLFSVSFGELRRLFAGEKKQKLFLLSIYMSHFSLSLMASSSNIDIEGATQHLRDMLKLDCHGNGAGKQGWKPPRYFRPQKLIVG